MLSITNELSKAHMLALDNINEEEAQSVNENATNYNNMQVEEWNKTLPAIYNSLYNMAIYLKMEENAFLLVYFKKLKDDDKKKALYDSLNKNFVGAYQIRKVIEDIKIIHANLNSKLNEIKIRIIIFEETCRRVVAQLSQKNFSDQNKRLIKQLKLIDEEKIQECQNLVSEIEIKEQILKTIYVYNDQDRANLCVILGLEIAKLFLNTRSKENLNNLKDNVDVKKKILDELQTVIFANEKLRNVERAKMENFQKVIESNHIDKQLLEEKQKQIKETMSQNEDKKIEILHFYKDPNIDIERLKRELEKQYTDCVIKINEEKNLLTDEIKKIKVVAKRFHLIFIIDESGSMEGLYNQVMSSVEKVINNRKALPLNKDRMSLIKFNSEAKIEIFNKSVNDEFKVLPMRGGGTTFVKPLERLVEILMHIKFDVEIPVVMFFSDGEGEDMQTVLDFIKRKIFNNSAIDKNCANNENMLFFTIGYGDKADKKTLEEMAKAFNKGQSFSSIGEEKLQFYYDVMDENQLAEAFKVYDKFFAFQKNIIATRRDLLDENLDNREQDYRRNCDKLDQLKAKKEEERKQEETKSKQAEADINAINEKYEEKIKEYNLNVQTLSKEEVENSKEYKNCESELKRLENIIVNNTQEYNLEKIEFDKAKKLYVEMENEVREFHVKLIESYKKDETFKTLTDKLKTDYEIDINEKEQITFKNQLLNFLDDFKDLTDDSIKLEKRSNLIKNKYKEVINVCKIFNSQLEDLVELTNNEKVKNRIWPMFVCRFYNEDIEKGKLEKMTDTEKKQILWKILYEMQPAKQETKQIKKKQDETDEDIYCVVRKEEENNLSKDVANDNLSLLRKAFNDIFSKIAIEVFFRENEDTPEFCDTFITKYTENIQKEIDDLIKEKTNRTNVNDQKRLQKEIDQKYEAKDEWKELRMEKSQILGLIKEKVKLLKEDYFQARIVYEFNKIFESMKIFLQMVDSLTISQQNAIN